jgi:hypothetical protein
MSVALVTMLDRARANTPYDAAGPVTAVRSFGKVKSRPRHVFGPLVGLVQPSGGFFSFSISCFQFLFEFQICFGYFKCVTSY